MGIKKLHWNSSSSFRFLGFQSFSHFFLHVFTFCSAFFRVVFAEFGSGTSAKILEMELTLSQRRERTIEIRIDLRCGARNFVFSQMTFGKKRSIVIGDCKKKINGIWLEMIFLLFGLKK